MVEETFDPDFDSLKTPQLPPPADREDSDILERGEGYGALSVLVPAFLLLLHGLLLYLALKGQTVQAPVNRC